MSGIKIKNFREECIKKGLKRIGFDNLKKEMGKYNEEKEFDRPEPSLSPEVKLPEEVTEKLFGCEPGFFGNMIFNHKKKNAMFFISSPLRPYKKIRDC